MNILHSVWKSICSLFKQTGEAAIHTSMWSEGYSDMEIDLAISDYREAQKRCELADNKNNTPK